MVGDKSRSGWLVADGGKPYVMVGFESQLEKNPSRDLRKLDVLRSLRCRYE